MKKFNSFCLTAILMVLFASLSLVSCSKDDDDEPETPNFENKLWIAEIEGKNAIMEFSDGTLRYYIPFKEQAVYLDKDINIDQTYTVKGNKITIEGMGMLFAEMPSETKLTLSGTRVLNFNLCTYPKVNLSELSEEMFDEFFEENNAIGADK